MAKVDDLSPDDLIFYVDLRGELRAGVVVKTYPDATDSIYNVRIKGAQMSKSIRVTAGSLHLTKMEALRSAIKALEGRANEAEAAYLAASKSIGALRRKMYLDEDDEAL